MSKEQATILLARRRIMPTYLPENPDLHFHRLARLLDLESRAEAEQVRARLESLSPAEAKRAGDCLIDLVITDESSGLGGRCLLTFAKRNRSVALPWTRLGVGAPVVVLFEGASSGARGVVCERNERSLRVAVAEPPDDEPGTCRVMLSQDERSRQRQRAALDRARTATRDRLTELRRVLLGEASPTFTPEVTFTPLNATLNGPQQEAVRFALSAQDLAIIHGPPGTGKTTTVVELIRQAVRRGDKVLACAPSNLAVDNLLERLVAAGERAVRLGHPAACCPQLREHTLDLLVEDHTTSAWPASWSKEAFALFRKAGKWTRAKPEPGAAATCARRPAPCSPTPAGWRLRRSSASSTPRPSCAPPPPASTARSSATGTSTWPSSTRRARAPSRAAGCRCCVRDRVVLAGDHCQLPPTVLSREAARRGLRRQPAGTAGQACTAARSRAGSTCSTACTRRSWRSPSLEFYDGELRGRPRRWPGTCCATCPACDGEPADRDAACSSSTRPAPATTSSPSPTARAGSTRGGGAGLPARCAACWTAGVPPGRHRGDRPLLRPRCGCCASSSPCRAWRSTAWTASRAARRRRSCCRWCGRNPEGEIGFLADVRRMNVALTRARRKLLVIGDSATLAAHPFYERLLGYFEAAGAYHTVWEEPPPPS